MGCRSHGISWVRPNGTQDRRGPFHIPRCTSYDQASLCSAVRGFLVLFPSRKNHQSTPTWIPVISVSAIALLVLHLRWLYVNYAGTSGCLFPARRLTRTARRRTYSPPADPDSPMSVDSFRALIRQALVECAGLTPEQAKQYGTHSLRVGAVEFLRQKGVPAELRQQLGGWLSATSALGYMQLPVSDQFSILRGIFK